MCEEQQTKEKEAKEGKINHFEKLIPRNYYESVLSGIPIFFGLRFHDLGHFGKLSEERFRLRAKEKLRKRGLHSETRTRGRGMGNAIDTSKVSLV